MLVADRRGATPLPPVSVPALIDSGSWKSMFPLGVARALGIGEHELVEDLDGAMGVGSLFRIWNTTVPIRAEIGLTRRDGRLRRWGPRFALSPVFIEHDAFLLGRADFFRLFTITFEATAHGRVFHLDMESNG